MQRYVQQVVDAMRASAKTRLDGRAALERRKRDRERFEVPTDPLAAEPEPDAGFEAHILEIEDYLAGPPAPAPSLAELAGVPLAELPVTDGLTESETIALINAIKAVVQNYGHAIDIEPRAGCPASVVYAYVLEELKEPAREYPGGGVHHRCCEAPVECVFGR